MVSCMNGFASLAPFDGDDLAITLLQRALSRWDNEGGALISCVRGEEMVWMTLAQKAAESAQPPPAT